MNIIGLESPDPKTFSYVNIDSTTGSDDKRGSIELYGFESCKGYARPVVSPSGQGMGKQGYFIYFTIRESRTSHEQVIGTMNSLTV